MKYPVVMFAVLMLIGACGDGDTGASQVTDDVASATTTSTMPSSSEPSAPETTEQASTDETEPDNHASDVSGIGAATATIEGETYLFGDTGFVALRCEPDAFGVFFAVLNMVDEAGNEIPGGGLTVTLQLEGTDPDVIGDDNSATLSLGEQEWIADPQNITDFGLEPGSSQVDSYTVDGNTASGMATFYEEESYFATTGGSDEPVKTAQGSFEVTCADE